MITLYNILKRIQNRLPEITFVVFIGMLGYAIYLLEWGLVQ